MGIAIRGEARVARAVAREVNAIVRDVSAAAEDMLRQTSRLAKSRTPREYGPLQDSAYVEVVRTRSRFFGKAGFRIPYAAAVHEAPMKLKGQARPSGKGNYWDPHGTRKFLSRAFWMKEHIIFRTLNSRIRRRSLRRAQRRRLR